MGVDLWQEPYNSVWGFPGSLAVKLNWNQAAERMGNHVLDRCARWLIMVQGVGGWPGSYEQDTNVQAFYGENLRGAKAHPVKLKDPKKLVYTPHICARRPHLC